MDTLPPGENGSGPDDLPYRLPSPLRHDGPELPVAPTAPRIPRALRKFNGMPPPPALDPPAPARTRPREQPQRTIGDLLIGADHGAEPEETGLIAGLRSAWRRLRHPDDEEA